MFSENYERQFVVWKRLRNKIEKSTDPFGETISFWSMAPLVNKHLDLFRFKDWPAPWDIIKEGKYDDLTKNIMIGHTLKLTKRFMNDPVEIRCYLDMNKKVVYNTCYIDNKILNYPYGEITNDNELSKDIVLQTVVPLPDYN